MDSYKVAHSETKDTAEAVKNIKEQLSGFDAGMVLCFVSSSYDVEAVSKNLAESFPGVRTAGCTTAGEMTNGKMGQNSIVAMAWNKKSLNDLKIEVLENIKPYMRQNPIVVP